MCLKQQKNQKEEGGRNQKDNMGILKTLQDKAKELTKTNDPYEDYSPYGGVEGDNSRWELTTEDVLEQIEMNLKGMKQDSKGKWYRPPGSKPKMNDEGVNDYIGELRMIMHKGTYLGAVEQNYASNMTLTAARVYKTKVLTNLEKWEVDITQAETIVYGYANNYYLAMTRPVGGKERQTRAERYRMQENYRHDEVKPEEIKSL